MLNKACSFSSQTFQLEGEATGRAIKLAKFVNTPLYVVHVMSIDALDEVSRARHSGNCGEEEYKCMSWLAIACLYHPSSFIEITLCLLSHFPSFSLQCFIGTSCLFLVITSYCYGLYVVCNCRRFNHEMMPVCFDSHCISAKVLYANWKSRCFVIKWDGAHLSASFTSMFLKQKVPLNLNAAL